MYILGINGGVRLGYQDVSAVLLKDGEIVAAIEEERLNRKKHSAGQLPELAVRFVLEQAGISMQEVGMVASHGSTWGDEYSRKLREYFTYTFGHCPPVERVHHHDAHAASAYYASGFDRAMVLSIDNSGDGVSTQLAVGDGTDLKVVRRWSRPHSFGFFYSLITQYCGFARDSDEYKLMGLSSYGNRNAFDFGWLLQYGGGDYRFNEAYIKHVAPGESQPTRQEMIFSPKLFEKLQQKRLKHQALTQHYMDVAASAQQHLENALVDLATHFHRQTGLRKLCLAGGVALNCVANQKLMNLDFIDEIYVQPASSDAGISLGAAYLLAARCGDAPKPMQSVYLGAGYGNAAIEKTLKAIGAPYRRIDEPARAAAKLVAQDKVVAWFQNRTEFGPRALGARSILAKPANKDMQDIVNRKIKFRESFRPFCPSVLEADAPLFFAGKQKTAPHMTITYDVHPEAAAKIPAVTHVDGTARIQTVNASQNALYHSYLTELKALTGMGVSLNTSFNLNKQPIVNTPREAVSTFYGCGLDALVIGDFLLEK